MFKNLAAFIGRSPDTASFEDIRRFQLQVAASGVGTGALNRRVSALRFLFRVTLKRYAIVEHTAFIHEPRKLPAVLSPEEVTFVLRPMAVISVELALHGGALAFEELFSNGQERSFRRFLSERALVQCLAGTHYDQQITPQLSDAVAATILGLTWSGYARVDLPRPHCRLNTE